MDLTSRNEGASSKEKCSSNVETLEKAMDDEIKTHLGQNNEEELVELRDDDLINPTRIWKCRACTGPLRSKKSYFGIDNLLAHAHSRSWTEGEKQRHENLAKLLKEEIDARDIDDLTSRNGDASSKAKWFSNVETLEKATYDETETHLGQINEESIASFLSDLVELRDDDLINPEKSWKCRACTVPLRSKKLYFGIDNLLAHAHSGSWTEGEKQRHDNLAKLLKEEIDARDIDDLMTRNTTVDSGNKHLDPNKEEELVELRDDDLINSKEEIDACDIDDLTSRNGGASSKANCFSDVETLEKAMDDEAKTHLGQINEEIVCDQSIASFLTELVELRDDDLINPDRIWKCRACTGPLRSKKSYFGIDNLLAHAYSGSWTEGEKQSHENLAKLLKEEIDARDIDDLMTRNTTVDSGNKHLDPNKEEVRIVQAKYGPLNSICRKTLSMSDCGKNLEVPADLQKYLQTLWDPRNETIQLILVDKHGEDEITVLVRKRLDGLFFSAPGWKSFLRKRNLSAGAKVEFFTTKSKNHVYVEW